MHRFIVRPLLVALCAGASAVQADEAVVKKGMEAFVGAPAVEVVKKTDYAGVYEVLLKSGELVYTNENVDFIIDGRIIDTKSRTDITETRLNQLSAIDFSTLALDQAIKQVRGDGARVIATFEDPNCGYCKRLGKELAQMDNVTIYTFLLPILSEDSTKKSHNIWCAEDQVKAWNDWILDGVVPKAAKCDTAAVEKNVAFAQSHRIKGTPTIFLADGRRLGGYLPLAQLEQALAEVPVK
ncbi:MAG TPA: DsbC family protein [Rhodocyclaceae bacterium]|nr:DsbC family protein [Rhodocyclaceae bacterium]